MKIGIEAQRLFRKKKHGMEVVALELIKQLQAIDKINQYIIFVRDDEDSQCIQETPNFKICVLKSYTFVDWEQYQLPKAVKKENVDFLHCTSNTAPLFVRVPLLVTIHDVIYLESINFKGSPYQNFGNIYRRIIVPKIAKKAKFIITVSDFEKNNIEKRLKIPKGKVHTIYNGKNSQFHKIKNKQELDALKLKYNLPSSFMLFLGNTSPRKNTTGVLLAYRDYIKETSSGLPLVITGLEMHQLKAMITKSKSQFPNIENHVKCLGYVDKQDLVGLYSMTSLYLYPSFREGFGLPIIEAMACEAPVITSNISSMPEVAGDAAFLVDPNQIKEITHAMVELTNNQFRINDYIKKGIERAKNFNWEKTANETLHMYKQMV